MRNELWVDRCVSGRRLAPLPEIQAFDGRRQVILRPDEIRSGDWLRDLGTLRQVVSMEELPAVGGAGQLFVLHFALVAGVEDLVLTIPSTVVVTVWRPA